MSAYNEYDVINILVYHNEIKVTAKSYLTMKGQDWAINELTVNPSNVEPTSRVTG